MSYTVCTSAIREITPSLTFAQPTCLLACGLVAISIWTPAHLCSLLALCAVHKKKRASAFELLNCTPPVRFLRHRASRMLVATALAQEAGQAMLDAKALCAQEGKGKDGGGVSYKGRHDL